MALNSRDIRQLERALQGNVHPELIKVIIRLIEDSHAQRQMIVTLAGLFDQLVNNQITMANATRAVQDQLPHIRRMKAAGMEVGSDPSLTGEINER